MKIIQYIETLKCGGAEKVVVGQSIFFSKTEEVLILVNFGFEGSPFLEKLKKTNIKLVSIYSHWNFFTRVFHKLFGKKYISYKLNRLVSSFEPDIFHAHLSVLKYVCNIKKWGPTKFFYTCHSDPNMYFSGSNADELFFAKKIMAKTNLTFFVLNEKYKRILSGFLNTRCSINVVHNGVDIGALLDNSCNKFETIKELGINKNAIILGHVGRMVAEKNHNFLIDVFNEIRKKVNVELILVGDGPINQQLKKRVNADGLTNYVHFLGEKENVGKYLSVMDCFVFPSIIEGYPLALIEAQIVGIPCVVSDAIDDEAIINNNVLKVNEYNIDKWISSIIKISGQRNVIQNREQYSDERKAKDIYSFYIRK